MSALVIALILAWVLGIVVLVALCRAAGRGDATLAGSILPVDVNDVDF